MNFATMNFAVAYFLLKLAGAVLSVVLLLFGSLTLLCRRPEFRKKILPQLGPAGNLIQPFLDSMPLKHQFLCGPHVLALISLMLYFRPDVTIADDELKQIIEQDEKPSMKAKLEQARLNSKHFLAAAGKVNILYAIPTSIFLLIFSVLDILSTRALQNESLSAVWSYYYRRLSSDFGDPRWVRDFALDIRPLVLTWFCLVPPIAIVLMLVHFCRTVIAAFLPKTRSEQICGQECLRLSQQIDTNANVSSANFYHSPWFNIAAMLPFVLGIPGAISAWLYFHLGIDPLLGYPSHSPQFSFIFSKIHMYIFPLGWCLSTLFFRSYFTFAWNFTSSEYDIEVYPDIITSLPVKGWFLDFITMRLWHMPTRISWKDVVAIKLTSGKLPSFRDLKGNDLLKLMGNLSSIYESMSNKLDIHNDYLEISTGSKKMSIRLWELDSQQKLDLFRCIREYAPSVYLDDKVQFSLVGSSVMKEPKYTEIWFSILSSKDECAKGDLALGHFLQGGRYQVRSMLASGGQAVVYLAERDDGLTVVLKEFQLTTGESLDAKIESARPFENESAILSQLSHDAIVKQLDLFYESGRVYLVLEHIEGMTLRELVQKRGVLPLSEVLALSQKLCKILRYLHDQIPPVVHRDFTPENIIVQPDGQLKLIDFSIAEHKSERRQGECAGKHSYTPPEQFRGEACPASDIYALGATIAFLLTGNDPTPITTTCLSKNSAPETLCEIVKTATALDLGQRYESIEWLLTDLQAIELGDEHVGEASTAQVYLTSEEVQAGRRITEETEKIVLAQSEEAELIKLKQPEESALVSAEQT